MAVTIHVLPSWAVVEAVRPATDRLVEPFGVQQWTLFAPRPPQANFHSYLLVRYRSSGGSHVTGPIDVSASLRSETRSTPWAPPRLPRVLSTMNAALEERAVQEAWLLIDRGLDPRLPPPDAAVREIRRGRAPLLDVHRRLLSAVAPVVAPEGRITEVRGLLVRTPLVPFEARAERPGRGPARLPLADADPPLIAPDLADSLYDPAAWERSILLFDSGWLRFLPDVTPLEVAP